MKKYLLILLVIPLLLYGCGQVSKQTGSESSNLTPEQQAIQNFLNSYTTAVKNKDMTTLETLFATDSPVKSQTLSNLATSLINTTLPIYDLSLISSNVSGNYIYAKVAIKYQGINSSTHYGDAFYNDCNEIILTTTNTTYKMYNSIYSRTSANINITFSVIRNNDNKLNVLIENYNTSRNASYNLDGLTATNVISNNYYYKDFSNNSFSIREDSISLGQFDFSTLTSFYSDNSWITNAIAKGVNYGMVTLNINEGYIFATKEITTNVSNCDYRIVQYAGSNANGETASFYNSSNPVYRSWNFPSSNINSLTDIDFDTATLRAGTSSGGNMQYLNLVYTNNKYYALQTINDNYPSGPVVFAWVELLNTGTRWYINQ